MRRSTRHVAVLAVAAVMLAALSVPAQGKGPHVGGGGGGGGIDAYCAFACEPDAWAFDEANTFRILRLQVWRDGLIVDDDEASGTGPLNVSSHGDLEGGDTVWFLLYKLQGDGVPKLIDSVACSEPC